MKTITKTELYELFSVATYANPVPLHFKDRFYCTPSKQEMKQILADFEPGAYLDHPDNTDNKALSLLAHVNGLGLALASIDVGGYEICVFVDRNNKLMQIDPLTKEIKSLGHTIHHVYMP